MSFITRFRAIEECGKAQAVQRLMESSTPDFDYFYMMGLSVMMATMGLLVDSPAIVIGSMLIAPVLFPILSLSLGLAMSDYQVLSRSIYTLAKTFALSVTLAVIATLIFANGFDYSVNNSEIVGRTEPSLLFLFVAIVAGLAVSYALARPEWNATLPGIAVSVAVLLPLAVVGIGIAELSWEIIGGSLVMLFINVIGIVAASMMTFLLMNLYQKKSIAKSTIKKEEERMEEEKETVKELDEEENHASV